MPKSFMQILAIPLGICAVYMCWLMGYTAGYEDGGRQAWDQARDVFKDNSPVAANEHSNPSALADSQQPPFAE